MKVTKVPSLIIQNFVLYLDHNYKELQLYEHHGQTRLNILREFDVCESKDIT